MRHPLLLLILVALLLWWLHPPRSLGPAPALDGDVVEITFMGPGGPISGSWADVVAAFEAESRQTHAKDSSHPVYRVISGQSAARDQVADPTRFLLSVAGGVPPDVIWFDRFAVAEWAGRGAFASLSPFIEADRRAGLTDYPRRERYYEACWNETVYQGQVYGVPVSVDNRALYYNKDQLIRAGLVYTSGPHKGQARPPRTWRELREYAVKLTQWQDKERGKLKVVGFSPQFGNSWLYMFGWMNGGEFLSADGLTCTLNDPRIVEALAYMKAIYDDLGGYQNALGFQSGFGRSDLDPFIRGQVAMKIDGSGGLTHLAAYGPDLNFGIAPPPIPESRLAKLSPDRHANHLTVSWTGGWALAIPQRAKHKQAAWRFIRFVTSDRGTRIEAESARLITKARGRTFVPNQCPVKHLNEEFFQNYVATNAKLPQRFKDGLKVFNDLLPYSRYRPVTPVGQRLWNAHRDGMEAGLYGEDPQTALDNQTAIVQAELNRFYAPPTGIEIRSWTWFFVLYGALIILLGTAVYLWDTNLTIRRRLAALLPWARVRNIVVIEGARGGYFRKQWKEGLLCAGPWIIGFIIFGGGPMLFSIVMSLCDYDVINPPRFIGLDNYRVMLNADPLFGKSLWNTAFMLLGIPVGITASLAVALLLNMQIRGMAVWRTFFYLPAIVPMVAASVLWIWIFNPQNGLINAGLSLIGIDGPQWLADAAWAKPSIIIMGLWGAGGNMIIWLAGLKGISVTLYEAASVDGANAWHRFRHVTIPQLTPYIFFNLVMGMIGTFQIFGQAFIMTQGGPNNATLFYVYHLFNNAFRYGKMGYASSLAWVLFVIVLILTVFQLKGAKRWVHYEAD